MGSLVALGILAVNAAVSQVRPWIGVVFAYTITLLAPQAIWWWTFDGIRVSFLATAPVILGCLIHLLLGRLRYHILFSPLNAWIAILWIFMSLSYFLGAYRTESGPTFYDSEYMYITLQKSFLAYLAASLLIDSTEKLKVAVVPILIVVTYMTYWANAQYLGGLQFGRIGGPRSLEGLGIYADENNFAVLFVIGVPFLIYLGRYIGGLTANGAVWVVTLFAWHAVFLTGSRGGLLGLAAVLLLYTLKSQRKHLALAAVAVFVVAFAWQGGDIIKDRMSTLSDYQEESSASSRLEAWDAATGMMFSHPSFGVGFAAFGIAFPDFSDKKPRDAHNTFFQIAAEWGLIAGCTYLALIWYTLTRLNRIAKALARRDSDGNARLLRHIADACMLSLSGFFVCSMFLSLQAYEVLYYLLLLSNVAIVVASRELRLMRRDQESERPLAITPIPQRLSL